MKRERELLPNPNSSQWIYEQAHLAQHGGYRCHASASSSQITRLRSMAGLLDPRLDMQENVKVPRMATGY